MDGKGKVEHGGPFRQFDQFAGRCEDIDFVLIQVHLEVLHQVERVVLLLFQGGTHGIEEFVQSTFGFHAFVFPVGCQSAFGDLIHPAGTDLHFHPFVLRAHDRDVQALVSIRLRNGNPVFHTVGVRLVHVGNDRIYLPAFRTFFFKWSIQHDTDREQIVYTFKLDLLLFQLVVDRVDGFGTSFDIELQARFLQLFLDRCNEFGYINVT